MQARIELPPEPTSPRRARHFALTTLTGAGHEELADVAILLVTELVTNAVLHAGTPVEVAVDDDGGRVRFEVSDGSPAVPTPRRHSIDAATGRGLRLVASLSTDWGTEATATGKRIWFVLGAGDASAEPDLAMWFEDDASWTGA